MMPVNPLDTRLSAMTPMSRIFYASKTHEGCVLSVCALSVCVLSVCVLSVCA